MNVGINAYLCSTSEDYRRTGVHRYIYELITALAGLDADVELTAFVQRSSNIANWTGVRQRGAPVPVSNPAVRIGLELVGLPVLIRTSRLDLFHGPVNTIPLGIGIPGVVTVHDLAFLLYPEHVTRKRYYYLKAMIGSSVRRARMILVPSQATGNDVAERFGISDSKIRVTPLGVDGRYRRSFTSCAESLDERQFILYVGTIEPRKNLPRLISASGLLQAEQPHDLVIAGPSGWLMAEVKEAIRGYPHPERIRQPGFLDDAELARLYASAAVVAMPSLYEGFGLPVLEAMSAGAAVLTSNISSMPEVAGDAAELVDPTSVDSIAEGLKRLLTDDTRRAELRARGLARAGGFTWTRTAELTLSAYKEALS